MAKSKTPPTKKAPRVDEEEQDGSTGDDGSDGDEGDDESRAANDAENKRINAIVTSRVRRELKGVNSALAAIQESLKALKKPEPEEDEESDEGTGTGEQSKEGKRPTQEDPDPKIARKLTKLERELADERTARKQAEKDRADELEKGKRAEMRSAYSTILTELGVTSPRLLRAALDQLEQDGVMFRDESGKIKFKGQDKYGLETNFDPKVGLRAWVSTEGKEFIPAVDAGGSGTGGSRTTGSGLTPKEFSKLSEERRAAINLERACTGLPPLGED